MLEIKNLNKTFNAGTVNEKQVLTDLSLTLKDGDFVTVIGGNGAGKSTLLNIISGVYCSCKGLRSYPMSFHCFSWIFLRYFISSVIIHIFHSKSIDWLKTYRGRTFSGPKSSAIS